MFNISINTDVLDALDAQFAVADSKYEDEIVALANSMED